MIEEFVNDPFGVPTMMKFHAGDEVEVVANLAGHNQTGLRTTVTGYAGQFVRLEGSAYNFYESDLKLLALTKDKVIERCAKAKEKYHLWQAKVDYLEETNGENFELEDFKKYAVKKLVDNPNLSSDDKVSLIHTIFSDEV